MRIRFVVASSLICCSAAFVAPSSAGAVSAGTGVTVNAYPNPSVTGDPIVVYGQTSAGVAGRPIRLYRSIQPRARHVPSRYQRFQQVTVQPLGRFEFMIPAGVVTSNWHFKVVASKLLKSRTIPELVIPTLTLTAPSTVVESGRAVVLSGALSSSQPRAPITLEYQVGPGGFKWRKLSGTTLNRRSRYAARTFFSAPGTYDIRAVFRRDRQSDTSVSDIRTIVVQQPQVPGFSAAASTPIVDPNKTATITGALDLAGTTTLPSPNTIVQLWERPRGGKFAKLAQTTTDFTGRYSFTVAPVQTEEYQVRVASGPPRHTAVVVIGVRQLVTLDALSRTAQVGHTVSFTGRVSPAAAGHLVVLQRLGPRGVWVTLQGGRIRRGSTYRIRRTIDVPGKLTFRVVAPGGPATVSGQSPARTIDTTLTSVRSLPRPT